MPIVIEDLADGVSKVVLSGRIDIAGSAEIETPMSVVCGSSKAVIVDLSGVSFMASLGLRSIVLGGKTVMRRGGAMALLSPQPAVEEVITVSGIDELFSIYRDEAAALAAVKPASN